MAKPAEPSIFPMHPTARSGLHSDALRGESIHFQDILVCESAGAQADRGWHSEKAGVNRVRFGPVAIDRIV